MAALMRFGLGESTPGECAALIGEGAVDAVYADCEEYTEEGILKMRRLPAGTLRYLDKTGKIIAWRSISSKTGHSGIDDNSGGATQVAS